MPAKKTTILFSAVIVLLGFSLLQPPPAQAGIFDIISQIIFGQARGKPTLYTEPEHCQPCRNLEAQLNARYGKEWPKYINISRGSPSGYIPYVTDANGQNIDQNELFSYLDQAVKKREPVPPTEPPFPPSKPPAKPSVSPPPPSSKPIPGSTPWRPISPPNGGANQWAPAKPVLHNLVFDAWLKNVKINPSKLDRKEIKVSADGKILKFQFCEVDENGNEKNCRIVEMLIPDVSDPDQYKKFVKALEDIFGGGSVPPELTPGKKPPPVKPSTPPSPISQKSSGLPNPEEAPKPSRVLPVR